MNILVRELLLTHQNNCYKLSVTVEVVVSPRLNIDAKLNDLIG